ncbi:MAG TPA: FhaA domain-containing protein [Anaerolineales bacterium]|nr:FhaA domain-containing protein [Anaerolineales bacterium]
MREPEGAAGWHARPVRPRLPWSSEPVRPAEVAEALTRAMLSPKTMLEDARYNKIVANRFLIEVDPENHAQRYALIEPRLLAQWREGLLEALSTANSRQGRREFRFGGRVSLELRVSEDLAPGQARVLARIEPDPPGEAAPGYRLESVPQGEGWPLRTGIVTIGREPACEVHLVDRTVQEKRLVSGQHAYLQCDEGQVWLFDGTPAGQPSTNGTYVNGDRVPAGGRQLRDGDLIVLAALDPDDPRPDTPGAAALRFLAADETADGSV